MNAKMMSICVQQNNPIALIHQELIFVYALSMTTLLIHAKVRNVGWKPFKSFKFLGSITGPAQKIPVPVMSLAPQIAPIVEKPQKRPSPVRMEGTTTTNFHTSARHFTTTTTTHAPILVQTLQPLTIKVFFKSVSCLMFVFSQFSANADHKYAQNVTPMLFVLTLYANAIRDGKEMEL